MHHNNITVGQSLLKAYLTANYTNLKKTRTLVLTVEVQSIRMYQALNNVFFAVNLADCDNPITFRGELRD